MEILIFSIAVALMYIATSFKTALLFVLIVAGLMFIVNIIKVVLEILFERE